MVIAHTFLPYVLKIDGLVGSVQQLLVPAWLHLIPIHTVPR